MRVGDDVLAAELEAALYKLNPDVKLEDSDLQSVRVILFRVICVLRERIEALA